MTEINWPEGWTPHADRDASEPSMRERAERAESVARGQQRLIEAQRAEVERLRAGWRKVTGALGYGDGITEPQIDVDNFVRIMQETTRDADEWRESQMWLGDCHMAGHPDDEDCFEHDPSRRLEAAEAEVERLLAEIADRQSERADLRDRVEKAEAAVGRVEAALDIRTRARAWMTHLCYEDHQIDKAEEWRQPLEPWLHDDPPQMVLDLDMACGFAREYEEVILAALRGDQ